MYEQWAWSATRQAQSVIGATVSKKEAELQTNRTVHFTWDRAMLFKYLHTFYNNKIIRFLIESFLGSI